MRSIVRNEITVIEQNLPCKYILNMFVRNSATVRFGLRGLKSDQTIGINKFQNKGYVVKMLLISACLTVVIMVSREIKVITQNTRDLKSFYCLFSFLVSSYQNRYKTNLYFWFWPILYVDNFSWLICVHLNK